MALRMVFNEHYSNYAVGSPHPNGAIYQAVQSKKDGTAQLVIRCRHPDGTYIELKRYKSGVDFRGIPGISQAIPLPDGSVYVSTCAGVGAAVAQFEDMLPGKCPPFTPGATYQYSVSAVDSIARQQGQAAVQMAQRAEATAEQAEDRAKEDGDKAEAKVLNLEMRVNSALTRLGTAAPPANAAGVLQAVRDDLNNPQGVIRHALWPILTRMVGEIVYLMLKNPASPLINVIKQGGKVIP